jgi:hypothetical protein
VHAREINQCLTTDRRIYFHRKGELTAGLSRKNRSQIFARFLIVRIKFPIWLGTDLLFGQKQTLSMLFYNLAGMQSL